MVKKLNAHHVLHVLRLFKAVFKIGDSTVTGNNIYIYGWQIVMVQA